MIDKEWSKDLRKRLYTPICDVCGNMLPTTDDFDEAVESMMTEGWTSTIVDDDWMNLCSECQ